MTMSPSAYTIDYLRVLISLLMLGYASYQDVKTRLVDDKTWIIASGFGVLIDLYEIYVKNLTLVEVGLSLGFAALLSGVLWYLGLFGEADLLAFFVLAIIHPRTPLLYYAGCSPLLFCFTIVSNSAIVGLLVAFLNLAVNLVQSRTVYLFERYTDASLLRRAVALFTGRYMSLSSVRGPPFEYPLEVDGALILRPDILDDDKAREIFKKMREVGVERVWVSMTLPYILVLLGGYVASIIVGDLMFTFMFYLTGCG